jgi:hypothetical protein
VFNWSFHSIQWVEFNVFGYQAARKLTFEFFLVEGAPIFLEQLYKIESIPKMFR